MDEHGQFYKLWFKRAGEDELSLTGVLQNGAPSTACFLAQQVAEKLLKGLLIYQGQEFPKVHDLLDLMSRLLPNNPDISGLQDSLELLGEFYTETRYVDIEETYREFSKEDAEQAYAAAMRVKEFVLEKIKSG